MIIGLIAGLIIIAWAAFIAIVIIAGFRYGKHRAFEDRQRLREANWRVGDRRR